MSRDMLWVHETRRAARKRRQSADLTVEWSLLLLLVFVICSLLLLAASIETERPRVERPHLGAFCIAPATDAEVEACGPGWAWDAELVNVAGFTADPKGGRQ